jgi:uncharacterized protein (TIGR03437 family)
VTILGFDLATDSLAADSTPLPAELAGTVVTVDGIPAPLMFVSRQRIDFQLSWRYHTLGSVGRIATVIVSTAAGQSANYQLGFDASFGPGILTQDGSGCGQGLILNVADDGSSSPNCPANSASPGGVVRIFALGIGYVPAHPPDGYPAPAEEPIPARVSYGSVKIGGKPPAAVLFNGLAPGMVGVFEKRIVLAADTPEGCAVSVVHQAGYANSQFVTMSVHNGGGQCVDPSANPDTAADIVWRRVVATGVTPAPPPESLTAEFTDKRLPEFVKQESIPSNVNLPPNCKCAFDPVPVARPCPPFADIALDAGTLTLTGPGRDPTQVTPGKNLAYQAILPSDTLTGGTFSVSGSGGADIGPFQTALTLPAYPPIQLTTSLPPGSRFSSTQEFTINWTGGHDGDIVHMRISAPNREFSGYCECTAPATSGKVTLPRVQIPNMPSRLPTPVYGQPDAVVQIFVQSEDDQVQEFTADGLSQGRHRWIYEWRFGGINFN